MVKVWIADCCVEILGRNSEIHVHFCQTVETQNVMCRKRNQNNSVQVGFRMHAVEFAVFHLPASWVVCDVTCRHVINWRAERVADRWLYRRLDSARKSREVHLEVCSRIFSSAIYYIYPFIVSCSHKRFATGYTNSSRYKNTQKMCTQIYNRIQL